MNQSTATPAAGARVADERWGAAENPPERWGHGRWSLERRGAELADVRLDGRLVLRAIQAVSRDGDWDTVPVSVTGVRSDESGLEIDLRYEGLGADLDGTLTVRADGPSLRVALRIVARSEFLTNRTGLIVLHPPTVAGSALTVTHPDGTETTTTFPERVAPWQPAMDIAALTWSAGAPVTLTFDGDVFEMEDQRNWTDASYKTYSRPLALPFPYRLAAGGEVSQSLVVRAAGEARDDAAVTEGVTVADAVTNADGATERIRLEPAGARLPALSLGASTAPIAEVGPVPRSLPASALLVELCADAPNAASIIARALVDAGGLPLDIRIAAERADDLEHVLDVVADARPVRIGVFSTSEHITSRELYAALASGVARRGMSTELVGGARSHFTELNRRQHDLPGDLSALTFSVTPQMHTTDRAQLVESVAMQRRVVQDARAIADGRPLHVGPVTLRSRFNAVAESAPAAEPEDARLGYGAHVVHAATDGRQGSPALAAWTVASAAALSEPGVASIAYFETHGPRGVFARNGEPFPVLTALTRLHDLSGMPLWRHDARDDQLVWAIGAELDGVLTVLVANLRSIDAIVEVQAGGATRTVRVSPLDFAEVTLRP